MPRRTYSITTHARSSHPEHLLPPFPFYDWPLNNARDAKENYSSSPATLADDDDHCQNCRPIFTPLIGRFAFWCIAGHRRVARFISISKASFKLHNNTADYVKFLRVARLSLYIDAVRHLIPPERWLESFFTAAQSRATWPRKFGKILRVSLINQRIKINDSGGAPSHHVFRSRHLPSSRCQTLLVRPPARPLASPILLDEIMICRVRGGGGRRRRWSLRFQRKLLPSFSFYSLVLRDTTERWFCGGLLCVTPFANNDSLMMAPPSQKRHHPHYSDQHSRDLEKNNSWSTARSSFDLIEFLRRPILLEKEKNK